MNPHARGGWRKKIRGKDHYFGRWEDPYGALAEYQAFLDRGAASKPQVRRASDLTLADAVNGYLASAEDRVATGGMKRRTWNEYRDTARRLLERMGRDRPADSLVPTDFAALRSWMVRERRWGATTTDNEVRRTKTIMTWIYATHFADRLPRFGPEFRRQTRKEKKRAAKDGPSKLLDPADVRAIIAESGSTFRAMVLLGINAGFGPEECCRLDDAEARRAIDNGWLLGHRHKTGEPRQTRLWSRTIAAMADAAAYRPGGDGPEFFRRPDGRPCWNADRTSDYVAHRWRAAKACANVTHGTFYGLRHTANTVGRQTGDEEAVRLMMGHVDDSIAAGYTHALGERAIDDDRIIAVSDRIAAWLALPG